MSDLPGTFPATEDPRNTASYRAARALAIGLGVLMVLAFIAVVVVLVTRFKSGNNTAVVSSQGPQIIQLPTGAKITDMQLDSGHVVLRIRTDQGEEVRIIDEASGNVVSRILVPK